MRVRQQRPATGTAPFLPVLLDRKQQTVRTIVALSAALNGGDDDGVRRKHDPLGELRGKWDHFGVFDLVVTLIKAMAVSVSSAVAPHLETAIMNLPENPEDELDIDWNKLSEAIFHHDLPRTIGFGCLRTLLQVTFQRHLEQAFAEHAPRKLAGLLIKCPIKSAVRKGKKLGRVRAARSMVRTSFAGNALMYLSSFIIDEALLVWRWLSPFGKSFDFAHVLKVTRAQVLAAVVGLAGSTIGSAAGTLIYPGWGTAAGAVLGELIPTILVLEK